MTTYVALLRGINVGSAKRIPMGDLRSLLESLGYTDVRTYLQSGNAIFGSSATASRVEREISDRIAKDLGMDVAVVVRSGRDMVRVVKDNPFAGDVTDPTKALVAFLSGEPVADRMGGIDPDGFLPERFQVSGKQIYLWCPYGVAGSTMLDSFTDRRLGVTVTIRNWRTVQKVAQLAQERRGVQSRS